MSNENGTENSDGQSPTGDQPQEVPNPNSENGSSEVEDLRKKYLYLYADFDNYKKRALKERSDHLKYGHEGLVRELLQVSDNLERALSASVSSADEKKDATSTAVLQGVELVEQQLKRSLTKFGVSEIKAVGEKFDPTMHEAVAQEKASDDVAAGTILKEHEKGFLLHGRLLRPSRVTVAV